MVSLLHYFLLKSALQNVIWSCKYCLILALQVCNPSIQFMIYESLLKHLRNKRSAKKQGSTNIKALEVNLLTWLALLSFIFHLVKSSWCCTRCKKFMHFSSAVMYLNYKGWVLGKVRTHSSTNIVGGTHRFSDMRSICSNIYKNLCIVVGWTSSAPAHMQWSCKRFTQIYFLTHTSYYCTWYNSCENDRHVE